MPMNKENSDYTDAVHIHNFILKCKAVNNANVFLIKRLVFL